MAKQVMAKRTIVDETERRMTKQYQGRRNRLVSSTSPLIRRHGLWPKPVRPKSCFAEILLAQ
ncbi:hypothetical protein HanIR_Chr16g0824931 [Helianthus annuus]|nr:hypothetical protein HanIR_Chr16g0824931 [Helianthus annuus]